MDWQKEPSSTFSLSSQKVSKTFPLFLSASHFQVAKTLMLYAKIKTQSASRENKTKN